MAKSVSGDTSKAALKQPDDRAVSKPQYDNKKAVVEPKKVVEQKKAAPVATAAEEKAAPVATAIKKAAVPKDAPAVEAPHKKHHHPVGLRRRATAIMRFNQIKAGHFRPSAKKIIFHNWVGKSKARVADRIRRTLARSQ